MCWEKTPPGPEIPPDIAEATRERYIEVHERITTTSGNVFIVAEFQTYDQNKLIEDVRQLLAERGSNPCQRRGCTRTA